MRHLYASLLSIPAEVKVCLLKKGQNFIFFNLFGNKADDYAQLYGEAAPAVGHDLAVMRVFVGEEVGPTGLGFGILISVSMLGLVSYAFLRKRK